MARPALDGLSMPPAHYGAQFPWADYSTHEQAAAPMPYAYSTVGTSTPLLTPATDGGGSSIASTPASGVWPPSSHSMAASASGYFSAQPHASPPVTSFAPQPRPRRAHSVSHLRHSPYAHAGFASHQTSPVFAPNLPMFAKTSIVPPVPPIPSQHLAPASSDNLLAQLSTQQEQRHQQHVFERMCAARHALGTLQGVMDRVGPVVDAALAMSGQTMQVDRHEVEAALDHAVAELKANFFRLDVNPPDFDETAHSRKRQISLTTSTLPAAAKSIKREEMDSPQLMRFTAAPPPLVHSQSTPVVPTYASMGLREHVAGPPLHEEILAPTPRHAAEMLPPVLSAPPTPVFDPEPGPSRSRQTSANGVSPTLRTRTAPSPPQPNEAGEVDGSVVTTADSLPHISDELKTRLDALFPPWLATVCSDQDIVDNKGEGLHQTLAPSKMQKSEGESDYRLFKFRIQAFTNRFVEDMALEGIDEHQMPYKNARIYLWQHPLVCRYNADGRKSKSKGNHVWSVDGRKTADGDVEFRPFERKIVLPRNGILEAGPGEPLNWTAHVFDPHTALAADFSSPPESLPDWLEWRRPPVKPKRKADADAAADEPGCCELSGTPPVDIAEGRFTIPVHASWSVPTANGAVRMALEAKIELHVAAGVGAYRTDADDDDEGEVSDSAMFTSAAPSPAIPVLPNPIISPPPPSMGTEPDLSLSSIAQVQQLNDQLPVTAKMPAKLLSGIASVMDVAKAHLHAELPAEIAELAPLAPRLPFPADVPVAEAIDHLIAPATLLAQEQQTQLQTGGALGPIQSALDISARAQDSYNQAAVGLSPELEQLDRMRGHADELLNQAVCESQSNAIRAVAHDPVAAAAALGRVDPAAAAVLGAVGLPVDALPASLVPSASSDVPSIFAAIPPHS